MFRTRNLECMLKEEDNETRKEHGHVQREHSYLSLSMIVLLNARPCSPLSHSFFIIFHYFMLVMARTKKLAQYVQLHK